MTSGGNRNDSNARGFSNLGRPRRMSFCPCRRSASRTQDSVISGASSRSDEEVRTDFLRFSLMTMPHANDSSGSASRRPDENNQSGFEPADGNESWLTVVVTIVGTRQVGTRKHFLRSAHVQPSFPKRFFTLRPIAGDTHRLSVATNIGAVNQRELLKPVG